ncbi:MAG: ABC transporter permease [Planctomycetes bacterium]|nr:ABC transporter permease [Planctomycetota bacterium]
MTEPPAETPEPPGPASTAPSSLRRLTTLRRPISRWLTLAMGVVFVVLVLGVWFLITTGEAEQRVVSPLLLPSPAEAFRSFPELWTDRALLLNLLVTVRRVVLGFLLAAAVGIPLGILCGCFPVAQAFFLPLTVFGRNIPLAALIPLTFFAFGVAETQKIMFIFIACVMFIVWDTAVSIRDVDQRYVDTAYTTGASRWQVIIKVLVPLGMPSVFNALRLLFGLAFGYIMLAELVKQGDEAGGLGDIIRQSQRRGMVEHIWLVLIIIPIVALGMDRLLFWTQRELFPHRYGGAGLLNRGLRVVIHGWEDVKGWFWQRRRTRIGAAAEQTPGKDGAS